MTKQNQNKHARKTEEILLRAVKEELEFHSPLPQQIIQQFASLLLGTLKPWDIDPRDYSGPGPAPSWYYLVKALRLCHFDWRLARSYYRSYSVAKSHENWGKTRTLQ
jgi:hypothetical protein